MATSLSSVIWCCSRDWAIFSTLASTLPYWAFMLSSRFPAFLNRPMRPFFSSPSPKPFSSTTRRLRSCPISPRSLLRTLFRALSEKPATLFCAAAPYCRIMLVSRTSILWENSSTAFFSSSVRSFSSISTGSIFFSSGSGTSGAVGSSVSWGTASAAAVGSRVSSGIMLSVMVIVPFYLILFVYSHFPEGAAPWAALLSGSFYSSSWMPSPSSPLSFSSAAGVSFWVWWMGSSLSPSRAIMFSSTVISVEISSA